jgi:hypothetical protein
VPTEPLDERNIQGIKYFKMLLPLFARLHDVGTARDKAGNRRLHFDQYCMLVLLSFFNPMLRSVRALQAASKLKSVQRRLGCPRTSLGSFSEAAGGWGLVLETPEQDVLSETSHCNPADGEIPVSVLFSQSDTL